MQRTVAPRAIGRGLAKVEPTSPNTLIAYAAKAGSTAEDGDGKNSPFTIALSQASDDARARRAQGVRLRPRRRAEGDRQPAGAVRLWLARRRRCAAGAGAAVAAPAAATRNPQADIRRDYELALQVGNKGALNAFLAQYPDGFYANLAKLQLDKIAAEETHAAGAAKARQAEEQRARLAAAGAQKDAQAKADADAKAAEQARLAAEKAKQVAQEQAAEPSASASTAAPPPAHACPAAPAATEKIAALNPARRRQADITKSVQSELRRVGCLTGDADGDWNATSQRSLSQFNRNAGTKLDVKTVECRYARCHQAEAVAGLSAGLRARLQGRWRSMHEDRLRRRLVPQRRQ